ncbi:hypothetical protein K469DRAFT_757256 [Zopfia rhizophila CBS 207.26]|uniref:Uncharacterized protein n=1 Tax=Zopfia rhizophila CBS 207.26 TaxID=1314779 RepID=A0A6A6EV53_9PEZI|nr:hypothetical protein K469DRAFT_757256 [Zopfia rhizophila CBS 207.26]
MVGVPKSTGYLICRKCCPGPPARHTFKDLGSRLNSNTSLPAASENGAVFQKFRISNKRTDLPPKRSPHGNPRYNPPLSVVFRQPSPPQHQELSRAFVDALTTGRLGHCMNTFGPFIREVLARTGHNAALDAAFACFVYVCTSMMSLEDPKEGMSSNTLRATILLGLVEALTGRRVGNQYLAYVSGAGRLMELQGPEKCEELCKGDPQIITSIYNCKLCFLTSLEWRDIAFDKLDLRISEFTALLRELRDLDYLAVQPLNEILNPEFNLQLNFDGTISDDFPSLDFSSDDFLSNPQNLKSSLCQLGTHLNAKLEDNSATFELRSIEDSTPIAIVFHFTNWGHYETASALDPNLFSLVAECHNIVYQICKTWEGAWASKPIGAFYTELSFVMAYEWCTLEVQKWVLKGMNCLLDSQSVETFGWSDEVIAMMCGKLAGEGPDMVFKASKVPA